MKNNEVGIKQIYLLMYKTNQSNDIKYKVFETLELARKFHLEYKKIVAKIGYLNWEIIHYQILVIPFNLSENAML